MRTKRECKTHGMTLHGAQNRCLLCKKDQSASFRAERFTARPGKAKKACERPGCTKKATMWARDPRWCGHAHRIWCYRQAKKRTGKRAKVMA